jgi:cyanate permease
VITTAVGPPLFAVAHDVLGSYRAGFGICASMPVVVALLSLKAENPQPHGL